MRVLFLIVLFLSYCGPNLQDISPAAKPFPAPHPVKTPKKSPVPTPSLLPSQSPLPTPTKTPSPTLIPTTAGQTVNNVYITFYGYDDNDDGEGHYGTAAISDPIIHSKATEDLGTYDRPSTFATDYHVASPGQRIYVPRFKKYYIMEDTCVECTRDWRNGNIRIDLYIGGNTALQGPSLQACEYELTADPYTDQVIFNPSATLPVETMPLYSNGMCF